MFTLQKIQDPALPDFFCRGGGKTYLLLRSNKKLPQRHEVTKPVIKFSLCLRAFVVY